MRRASAAMLVAAMVTAAACSDSDEPAAAPEPDTPAELVTADPALGAAIAAGVEAHPAGCDPLDERHCLLPFPSDALTIADDRSDTGRRLALPAGGMPTNAGGVPIDASEWNRNDGFSPNSTIVAYVDGLDPEASDLPAWTDLDASLAADATVAIVDMDTGERVPLWAEPDVRAAEDGDRLLVIHPAVGLPEGHRIAVALRGLVRTDGSPAEPSPVFVAYRDRIDSEIASVEERRGAMEDVFAALGDAGIARDDLLAAWDFTVASERNLSERMLHIRDEALDLLDGGAPAYEVRQVLEGPEEEIAIEVHGTVEVPNYLTGDGGPGNRFHYGDDGSDPDRLPVRNGTATADFACQVPVSATTGERPPASLALYGHGLLGTANEVRAGNVRAMAEEHAIIFCATKWAGMSMDDVGNAVDTLGDISNFPTIADRLQQGVLNQILLGRLMLADDGLFADPALAGVPVDRTTLLYDGNSQGGIMGGMLAAVSPDIERAVLGVPGMKYSLLLYRSIDWDAYEAFLVPAYPSDLDRALIVALIQHLWDRGEASGYVHHLGKDAYQGSAGADVLLHVAFGDQQVTELSAMVQARTIGARIHRPVVADGHSAEREPGWGIESIEYPHRGSAIVFWDSGAEPIPFEATPPRIGFDPHEDPRADREVRRQKAVFLVEGELVDVCGGDPCEVAPRG